MGIFGALLGKREPKKLSDLASEMDWSDPDVYLELSKTYDDHFEGEYAALLAAWSVYAFGRSTYIMTTHDSPDESGVVIERRLKMAIEVLSGDGDLREKYFPFLSGVDQRKIKALTERITEWCPNPKDRLQISHNLAEAILSRHIVMPDEL